LLSSAIASTSWEFLQKLKEIIDPDTAKCECFVHTVTTTITVIIIIIEAEI